MERAVARFDFKDGSDGKDQTYVLGETEDKATLKVKLTKMALVNMSKISIIYAAYPPTVCLKALKSVVRNMTMEQTPTM